MQQIREYDAVQRASFVSIFPYVVYGMCSSVVRAASITIGLAASATLRLGSSRLSSDDLRQLSLVICFLVSLWEVEALGVSSSR